MFLGQQQETGKTIILFYHQNNFITIAVKYNKFKIFRSNMTTNMICNDDGSKKVKCEDLKFHPPMFR